jgi:hypothetical protein
MRIALSFGFLFAASAYAAPAFATTDAYVLIETTDGRGTDVLNTNWGFGQCKGLAHKFRPNEIVVQIACDDQASLQKAVGSDIPARDGVKRVTLWTISTEP